LRKENLPDFPKDNKSQIVVKIERQESENRDLSLNNKANEKEQIIAALNQARGNKTVAAKMLQIDRKTLYNKMHLYGIEM
jgi:DNA-binding NtrC family response regulator